MAFISTAGLSGGVPHDRLLRMLQEVDVGQTADSKLDRYFDFHPPDTSPLLMDFSPRSSYDRELLLADYQSLPTEVSSHQNRARFQHHRDYVAMMRRQLFFETRDDSWRKLIPYASAQKMLKMLTEPLEPRLAALNILHAINRGEGIADNKHLPESLALQVRQVEAGTVRSYRVFPAAQFELLPREPAHASPYIEHSATALLLRFSDGTDLHAELVINLDVFEMSIV